MTMMNARRRRLQVQVAAEKQKIAGVGTASAQIATRIIPGKHFFIEAQPPDNEGEVDLFAIYRTTDLLSTVIENEPGETPAPVHVCELATDAAVMMGVLDKLVDQSEGEEVLTPEWPVAVATRSVEADTPTEPPAEVPTGVN